MKVNLDEKLMDFTGKQISIVFAENSPAEPQTIGTLSFSAVTASLDTDRGRNQEETMRNYALAQKVHKGGTVDLTAEEIALIKARINSAFNSVIVVGAAYTALEK